VVFARKLREGETGDSFDLSTAALNPEAQGLDWDAITSGMNPGPTAAPVTTTTVQTSETAFMITRPRATDTESPVTTAPETATESPVTTVPETEAATEPPVTTAPETAAETQATTVPPETESSESVMIMTR
jgi:hypothetical protein